MLAAFSMLVGVAHASPIEVDNLKIEEINGEYIVLLSLQNEDINSGNYTEVSFSIDELGTSKNMGVVKVDTEERVTKTYKLREITDSFELLKKGETYTLTGSTDDDSEMTKSFLFGSSDDTDGLNLIMERISINEEQVRDIDTLQVLNGEELQVSVRFSALENFDNARLRTFIEGYEHSPIMSSTEIFSVREGKTYVKTMTIDLPDDMRSEQNYKLRIEGANDLSGLTYKELDIFVDTQRHRVDVLDLITTPSSGVEPGQNIVANVRLQNRGQQAQESTRVVVSIPELGISEASYVSNLGKGEVATSDDMLLFIPSDAKAGQYEVEVTAEYNDGYDSSNQTHTLNVQQAQVPQEENLIVSFDENIDLRAGEANSFDVVVANPNQESKPVSLETIDDTWADVKIDPNMRMVSGGGDAVFTVTVTPKESIEGEKDLVLSVRDGSDPVSEIKVSAYVEAEDTVNWTNVVLAVLLLLAIIVLLALVIVIARKRNEEQGDESKESTEEYY